MLSTRVGTPRSTARALWLALVLVPFHIAFAGDLITFDVPAGPASETLPIYTSQAGLQVLYGYDDVRGIVTNPVRGELDAFSALEKMTKGTRLRFDLMDGDTITLTVLPPGHEHQSVPRAALEPNA